MYQLKLDNFKFIFFFANYYIIFQNNIFCQYFLIFYFNIIIFYNTNTKHLQIFNLIANNATQQMFKKHKIIISLVLNMRQNGRKFCPKINLYIGQELLFHFMIEIIFMISEAQHQSFQIVCWKKFLKKFFAGSKFFVPLRTLA